MPNVTADPVGRYCKSETQAKESLARFMAETGTVNDLEELYNCPVHIIHADPAWRLLEAHQAARDVQGLPEGQCGEHLNDIDGIEAFVEVGRCRETSQRPEQREHPEPVTRNYSKAVKAVITAGVSDRAKRYLEESTRYVLPPETEPARVKSLQSHACKIYRAVPGKTTRYLLEKCASRIAENQPAAHCWHPLQKTGAARLPSSSAILTATSRQA